MQLTILADAISIRQIVGPIDRKVESIAYDSRRVQRNGMFVALRGEKTDGHNFIGQAIEKGASVIVAEREEKDSRATFLVVEDTRSALTGLAATFYRRPADRLKIAGVTGTNGKATIRAEGATSPPTWRAAVARARGPGLLVSDLQDASTSIRPTRHEPSPGRTRASKAVR